MKINYYVYDPSGNITVLAEGDGLSESGRLICARRLMDEAPEAEQVGFIMPAESRGARGRLQMAGGEFCGNAAMSLGVHLAREDAVEAGGAFVATSDMSAGAPCRSCEMVLDVSGAEGAVCVGVTFDGEGGVTGNVAMPLPDSVGEAEFHLPGASGAPLTAVRLPVVRLPGITHIIVPDAGAVFAGLADEDIERMFTDWTQGLNSLAFGLLVLGAEAHNINGSCRGNSEGAAARQGATANRTSVSLRPLLYVPEAGTLVWENACGTGSAAVAAWIAVRDGKTADISLSQPGGSMRAHAELSGGEITGLSISGRVAFVRGGQIEI
jgi:diaminopimelate epimerase